LRRGDLTLRKPHYQTSLAGRQPLAKPSLIATIQRDEVAGSKGINPAHRDAALRAHLVVGEAPEAHPSLAGVWSTVAV
jgi:hypothetical protein